MKTYLHFARYAAFILLAAMMAASLIAAPASAAVPSFSGSAIIKDGDTTQNKTDNSYPGYELEFDDNSGITFDQVHEYAKEKLGWKYGFFWLTSWTYCGPATTLSFIKGLLRSNFMHTGEVNELVGFLSTSFLVVGRLLCLLYFLLSLMDAATRDSFTIEVFVKSLAKLAIIFVIFSPDTIETITMLGSDLGDWVIERALKGSQQAGYQDMMDFVDVVDAWGLLASIGALLSSILSSFSMLAETLVVFVVVFGRAIEITVYQSLLPLAMGPIFDGGLRSPGFRYIKKWMALHLQGGILIVILIMVNELKETIVPSLALPLNAITDPAIALAAIALICRSKSIANDVMGV